jgi:hypothetical protein
MSVNLMELEPGDRVDLVDGTVMEVVDNPRDGAWIICTPVDGSGGKEVVFLADVIGESS